MAVKGYSGSCTADGTNVGTAKIWSLDITQETTDSTNFASNGWKESVATLKSWGGNITVVFDAFRSHFGNDQYLCVGSEKRSRKRTRARRG